MGQIYEKKKDEDRNAMDFMEMMEKQQSAQCILTGETMSPLPYDVEKKRVIVQQNEVEQRPK